MRYPLVASYRVSNAASNLLGAWLAGQSDLTEHNHLTPVASSHNLHYFPDLAFEELRELMEWRLPLLLFYEEHNLEPEKLSELVNLGVAGLVALPHFNQPLLFPELKLPPRRGTVFGIIQDAGYRQLLRQVLQISGYDLRSDFKSGAEMLEIVKEIKADAKPENKPTLLLIDLDCERIDVPAFCYQFKRVYINSQLLQSTLPVMVLKDFNRPGIDIQSLAANLRPFTRRIFHPREGVLALIESFFFLNMQPPGEQLPPEHFTRFRNIHQLLFGTGENLPGISPRKRLDYLAKESALIGRQLPLLKLYDILSHTLAGEGALLASQPEVNTGNLLDGIGSPDAAGKVIQNPGE